MIFDRITITFTTKDDPTSTKAVKSLDESSLRYTKQNVSSGHYYKGMTVDFPLIEIGLLVAWGNREEIISILKWLKEKGFEMFGRDVVVEIPTPDGQVKIRAKNYNEAQALIESSASTYEKITAQAHRQSLEAKPKQASRKRSPKK